VNKIGVLLVACMSGFGSLAVHASCVDAPPSSILDLSHWKLTLPVDSGNGTGGDPAEISAHDLAAGYRSGYFCVDPDSRPGHPVFNRTVTLKDSWAKIQKRS